MEIRLRQGSAKVVITQQAFTGPPANEQRVALQIAGGTLGLREGAATLEVLARDGFWRPIRVDDRPIATAQVSLDFTPPSLEIVGATRYWAQGGGGLVVLRSKGASRVAVNVGGPRLPRLPGRVSRLQPLRRPGRPALELPGGAAHRGGAGRGRKLHHARRLHRGQAAPLQDRHHRDQGRLPRAQAAGAPARARRLHPAGRAACRAFSP